MSVETVEVTREDWERIKQRLNELELLVEARSEKIKRLEAAVKDPEMSDYDFDDGDENLGWIPISERLVSIEDRLGSRTEPEPTTKVGKVKRAIDENFDQWSVRLVGGEAVATKVREAESRGREGRSINKHVREWMSDRYDESVQHVTVYDAMRQLGELPRYGYEERGDGQTRYYLWRTEGKE